MKHKIPMQPLVSAPFAFILSLSSIGALITGYALPINAMWSIYLWCAIAAIATAVLLQVRHGGKIIAGIAALAVFIICLIELIQPHIQEQFKSLFYYVSLHYHDVYNWPILGTRYAVDVSTPMILWAFLVAFCVNWYICRRKHIVVAIIPTILPLSLCLMTTDKVPHTAYLYLLIIGLATLFVTDWTRRKQPEQGTKLVLWTIVPVALFFALIFVCSPQENYVNRAGKIQKEMSVWIEKFQDAATAVMNGTPIDTSGDKKRNLRAVAERSTSTRSVMAVKSPVTGTLYLRERDFDIYNGTDWEASSDRKEVFTSGANSVGTLFITTYGTKSAIYVPYYATSKIELVGGVVENEENLQQYSYSISNSIGQKSAPPNTQYKKLPAETKAWAKELADEITEGAKNSQEKVQMIQDYVRNCATYDTNTGRMDSAHADFAQWFLESEAGYCIHYATLATVLLRAAGINARYVEGYIISGKAGVSVVVSKQEAHSWVEYYDWGTRAWCILEATPVYAETDKPDVGTGTPVGGVLIPDDSEDIPPEDLELPPEDVLIEVPSDEEPPDIDIPEDDTPEDEPEEEPPTEEPPAPTEPDVTDPPDDSSHAGASQSKGHGPWKMPTWLKFVMGGILLIGCVLLQGYLRICRKRKLWNRGTPNRCTIWRWKHTRSLAKRLKQLYPEDLDDLALKARFSQYEIQPEELQKYADYRLQLMAAAAEKPWYQRILNKWIFAIG